MVEANSRHTKKSTLTLVRNVRQNVSMFWRAVSTVGSRMFSLNRTQQCFQYVWQQASPRWSVFFGDPELLCSYTPADLSGCEKEGLKMYPSWDEGQRHCLVLDIILSVKKTTLKKQTLMSLRYYKTHLFPIRFSKKNHIRAPRGTNFIIMLLMLLFLQLSNMCNAGIKEAI